MTPASPTLNALVTYAFVKLGLLETKQTARVSYFCKLQIFKHLGPFKTSLFSCAEPNVNEQNPLFELICIKFGAWEDQRLN